MAMQNTEAGAAYIPPSTANTETTGTPTENTPAISAQGTPEITTGSQDVTPAEQKPTDGQPATGEPPALTLDEAQEIIKKQQADLNYNKQKQESQEKLEQAQQQITQSKTDLSSKYSYEKLNTYNKYIPFLTDPNAVNAPTEQEFLNALPPVMAAQLGRELAGVDNKYSSELKKLESPLNKIKEETLKTGNETFIEEFKKINAKDLAIPVVKEMVDLVIQDLTGSGQKIVPEVMDEYKNNIKKIYEEGYKAGQLTAANQTQAGRMKTGINGLASAAGKVYSVENPPSLEEMKDLKIFEANEAVIMQAMANGHYNKK